MQRFLEFVGSHYILVSLFIGLVGLLLVTERRKAGEQLSPMRANQLVNHEEGLFLDVREEKQYRAGHIVSSKNINHSKLKDHLAELEMWKDKPVIVACEMGQHSAAAGRELAAAARDFVTARVGGGDVILWDVRYDKFGGRVLARVETGAGADLGSLMIGAGLGRAYDGGKRKPWC